MAKSKSGVKKLSDTFVWVILLLIFVGLGGYGAFNFSRGVTTVGEVGETPISVTRYITDLNAEVAALGRQFNQSIPISMARQFGVDKQVLQNLVGEVAAENEAHALGVSVGDEAVAAAVRADPQFGGISGTFDVNVYRDVLKRRGYTVTDYEDEVRASLARGILQSAIVGGVAMPAAYADSAYNYAGERRAYSWAKVTTAQLETPVPAPTDADIQAWYDAHPADFTAPEIKRINYIALKPDEVAKTIPVDEEKLRQFYQDRITDYVVPERRLVERLIFADRAAADAAMAEIAAGTKTFDDFVTARGLTLDDVDLGEQTKDQLGAAGEAVFALTEPGIAGPVDIDLGAAIFRMNAILVSSETPFEEARADLQQEYALASARTQIKGQIEAIDNDLAAGMPLAEVAESQNMEHGQIDYVAGEGEGMVAYQDFAKAADAVTAEDFAAVRTLDDGGVFALELEEIIPPTLKPLAEVRDQVVTAWTLDTTRKAVADRAAALIARLASGEAGDSLGVTFIAEDPITREHFVEDFPANAITELFKMENGTTAQVDATEGDPMSLILTLTDVLPPDPNDASLNDGKVAFAQQGDQQFQTDILRAWAAAVQGKAGVRVDQATLDAILNQYN